MMDPLVFVIAGFLVALFAALCTVYFFIYRPPTKEKRKQLLKKIVYLAVAGAIVVCLLAIILPLLRNGSEFKEIHSRLTSNDSLSVSRKDLSNLEDTSPDYNTTNKTFAMGHEHLPYHICSSTTTLHRIYHDGEHPSHLLLPIIPRDWFEDKRSDEGFVAHKAQPYNICCTNWLIVQYDLTV